MGRREQYFILLYESVDPRAVHSSSSSRAQFELPRSDFRSVESYVHGPGNSPAKVAGSRTAAVRSGYVLVVTA
jgi:hypothetical protein